MPFTKDNSITFGFLGHKHTDETKKRISVNRKGKGLGERPEWVKQKISQTHLRKHELKNEHY